MVSATAAKQQAKRRQFPPPRRVLYPSSGNDDLTWNMPVQLGAGVFHINERKRPDNPVILHHQR